MTLGTAALALASCILGVWLFHHLIRLGLRAPREIPRGDPGGAGLDYRDVRIGTENGKTLRGWFIPPAGHGPAPAVAVLHGWGGNGAMMLPLAGPLHRAGFGVLLFDARCHGRSDGDSFASLPRFAEDLDHAADWLKGQPEVDPGSIALLGHSVGAGAALLAASRRRDIAAVVSIAAFAHPAAMMKRFLASRHVAYVPLGWYVLRYVQHAIGHRFDDIAPRNTVRGVRCPVLLVHGDRDETVPVAEAEAIYANRPGNWVRLLVLPGDHDSTADLDRHAADLVAFLREAVMRSPPDT